MDKKKFNKKTLFIILGLLLIGVLTVAGTYAYFAWNSTEVNKDASISVNSVNGIGQCNKSTDNGKILWPVSSRNKGRIVTVNTKQTLSEYAYITWTLTIDSINTEETETSGLKHQTFKYELVNTTTGVSYGSGNFQNLDVGDTVTFSNNTENLAYDTNYIFTLYLWIDGTIGNNPMDMTNQTYEFSLVCDITGEASNKVNEPLLTPITDFIYILGSEETTISSISSDFYNSSNQTISRQNNVSLPASINIGSNDILLLRYIGSDSEVNIPTTYTVNGNTYNVVLLSYANDGNNLSTGLFYHNNFVGNVYLNNNSRIISLNSNSSGYDSNSMSNMFNSCTSLGAVLNIPSTITNMESTFSGSTNITTIDLSNVDLEGVTAYTNALSGVSTTATIIVPNCTQYRLFVSKFGSTYTGLTATDSDYTCYYQIVEYIQSSGTQYIDTGMFLTGDDIVKTTFKQSTSSQGMAVYGSYISGEMTAFYANNTYYGYNSSSTKVNTTIRVNTSVHNVIHSFKDGFIKVDSNTPTQFTHTSFTAVNSHILFARRYNDIGYMFVGNIYSHSIERGEEKIMDLVPCYSLTAVRDVNNVAYPSGTVGMYDFVNNVFYTNANTAANSGTFTAGPIVNS